MSVLVVVPDLELDDLNTSVYHELHIGGKEFSVDEGLADVMMQGDEYIIYYDMDNDEIGNILSAELISKAK